MFFRTVTLGVFIAIIAGIGATLIKNGENYGQPDLKLNNDCHSLQIYLSIPGISGPIDNQHKTFSKLFVSHNVDSNKSFLNPNDPTAKSMGNSIEKFNAFYDRFNRLIRLGNTFQLENKPDPLVRNEMDSLLIRETKETRWLAKIVSHRMKLIEIHKKLWFVYNKLQKNEEIDFEELESMKKSVNDLERSEERLRQKTENFILYVLKN